MLIVCALLAIGCWAESVRQLHRSARPAEHDVLPSGLQSGSWLLTFSGEAHAQGLDLALGGLVIPGRAFWIPASSSLSPPDASWLAGPRSAFWDKAETACASDPRPVE